MWRILLKNPYLLSTIAATSPLLLLSNSGFSSYAANNPIEDRFVSEDLENLPA